MEKLKRVSIYHASDRRCYNGAFCSDMEKELASKEKARDYLKSLGVSVTYFPAGSFYVGFDKNHKVITEDCSSFETCANACIESLENLEKQADEAGKCVCGQNWYTCVCSHDDDEE